MVYFSAKKPRGEGPSPSRLPGICPHCGEVNILIFSKSKSLILFKKLTFSFPKNRKKSHENRLSKIQLNEYETASYFIQFK